MSTATMTEHDLGPISLIPAGASRAYDVAGRQLAVFHLRSGALRALDAVCPHKGGPIADGQSDGRVVLCPLHLTAFDLTTGCAVGSDYRLTPYPVALDAAGHVIVTLPAD